MKTKYKTNPPKSYKKINKKYDGSTNLLPLFCAKIILMLQGKACFIYNQI